MLFLRTPQIEGIEAYWCGFGNLIPYLIWEPMLFNLELKFRVTMLTRKEWIRGPGTHTVVKGLVWFTDGSRTPGGTRGWSLWAIFGKKVQCLSRKIHYSFPGRDLRYLGLCLWNSTDVRSEKCVSIRSDSQGALKTLKAVTTTSPLEQQC